MDPYEHGDEFARQLDAGDRFRLLIERPAFPSDRFVVETQLAWHGIDPSEAIVEVGDACGPIDEDEVERFLAERGDGIVLVFMGGVTYLTGEALDVARITRAAHAAGCLAGSDMAHAAGNVPLTLHDAGADFAARCAPTST